MLQNTRMRNFTQLYLSLILGVTIVGFSTLKLNAQCNAAFTYVVNAPSVIFTAQDSTPLKSSNWYFGDGQSSFGTYMASHTYYQPGEYLVTHYIFDSANNCADSSVQMVAVNFTSTCQAYFSIYPMGDSLIATRYLFEDVSIVPGNFSAIKSYLWTINDATVDSTPNLVYTFSLPGAYNVCLSIKTYAGCTSQYCQQVTLYDRCNLGPTFTYTVDSLFPATVSLFPHPDVAGIEYEWRLNGNLLSVKTPVTQYYQSGTYPVTLFMVDTANRCYDSTAGTFAVPVFPCDTIRASVAYHTDANDSSLYYFTAQSNDALAGQSWNIRSMHDSSLNIVLNTDNPSYHFTDTGYYEVCLNANTLHCGIRGDCEILHVANPGSSSPHLVTSYPNPASNSVGFDVPLAAAASISINVFDEHGNRVFTLQRQGVQGSNHIDIPVMRLNPGQYFIDITTGTERKRSVFQKF